MLGHDGVWGRVVQSTLARKLTDILFDTDCDHDHRLNRRMFMARAFKCEDGQTVNCPKDEVRFHFLLYVTARTDYVLVPYPHVARTISSLRTRSIPRSTLSSPGVQRYCALPKREVNSD